MKDLYYDVFKSRLPKFKEGDYVYFPIKLKSNGKIKYYQYFEEPETIDDVYRIEEVLVGTYKYKLSPDREPVEYLPNGAEPVTGIWGGWSHSKKTGWYYILFKKVIKKLEICIILIMLEKVGIK